MQLKSVKLFTGQFLSWHFVDPLFKSQVHIRFERDEPHKEVWRKSLIITLHHNQFNKTLLVASSYLIKELYWEKACLNAMRFHSVEWIILLVRLKRCVWISDSKWTCWSRLCSSSSESQSCSSRYLKHVFETFAWLTSGQSFFSKPSFDPKQYESRNKVSEVFQMSFVCCFDTIPFFSMFLLVNGD